MYKDIIELERWHMEQYTKNGNKETYYSSKYEIALTMTSRKWKWCKIEVSYIHEGISFTIKTKADISKNVAKMKCNVDKKLVNRLFRDLCKARYSRDEGKLSEVNGFLEEVIAIIFEGTTLEAFQTANRTVTSNRSQFDYVNPYLGSMNIELNDDGEYNVQLDCVQIASGKDKECTVDEQYDDLIPVLYGFSYCLLGEIPYAYDRVLQNVRAKEDEHHFK